MSIENLRPRHKHDHERLQALIAAGPVAAEPILEDLFEWLWDMNYPIAIPLSDFLITVGDPLIPHLQKILRLNDYSWIGGVLDYVVARLAPEHIHILKPELDQLVKVHGLAVDVIHIGISAGIWDQKTLSLILDTNIQTCEERLPELKELKAKSAPDWMLDHSIAGAEEILLELKVLKANLTCA
ncbi:DUF5071 domain-containing protein [Undibacterium sp. JH2W]|uniref:DUF5071 domain-containing protein n=1 Tax=Undibacterium sp. JH2W TaxID=3413037 RepID=UPI003BF3CE25